MSDEYELLVLWAADAAAHASCEFAMYFSGDHRRLVHAASWMIEASVLLAAAAGEKTYMEALTVSGEQRKFRRELDWAQGGGDV